AYQKPSRDDKSSDMSTFNLRNSEVGLFPELPAPQNEERTTGILPSQTIRELIDGGRVAGSPPITPEQIQPASLDLPLGVISSRVRESFLQGPNVTVDEDIT